MFMKLQLKKLQLSQLLQAVVVADAVIAAAVAEVTAKLDAVAVAVAAINKHLAPDI